MKLPRIHIKGGRYYFVRDLEERSPTTGRPKQKWIPLTRVDQGEAAMIAARDRLLGIAPARVGNMRQLLEAFRLEHLPGLTPDVAKEYGRMLDFIAAEFEAFDVDQVQPGDVLKFLNLHFLTATTARRHYKARLSTFFSWCVLNAHLKVNPCAEIRLRAPAKRRGRMNDANFWRIYDALPAMGQCFLELLFLTRQRPTEIRLLRESAIGDRFIRFRPTKTEDSSGEEVQILVTPAIRRVLERARSLRRKDDQVVQLDRKRDPYLIQTVDGGHFTKSGLNSVWRRALATIGIDGVTTRDVRPYALHKMEAAGYDLRQIQLAAAHSSATTTEGYLDQHRDRISEASIELPARPAK